MLANEYEKKLQLGLVFYEYVVDEIETKLLRNVLHSSIFCQLQYTSDIDRFRGPLNGHQRRYIIFD